MHKRWIQKSIRFLRNVQLVDQEIYFDNELTLRIIHKHPSTSSDLTSRVCMSGVRRRWVVRRLSAHVVALSLWWGSLRLLRHIIRWARVCERGGGEVSVPERSSMARCRVTLRRTASCCCVQRAAAVAAAAGFRMGIVAVLGMGLAVGVC